MPSMGEVLPSILPHAHRMGDVGWLDGVAVVVGGEVLAAKDPVGLKHIRDEAGEQLVSA